MFARISVTSISLIILLTLATRTVYAMEEESFSQGLVKRVLTAKAAVLLGYCLDKSTVSPEIKKPLFIALFLIGTYGLEPHKPPCITPTSDLLQLAHTGTAIIGTKCLVSQLDLPEKSKECIYVTVCAAAIMKLCKENSDDSYDD